MHDRTLTPLHHYPEGKLIFHYGPMYSGKSNLLINHYIGSSEQEINAVFSMTQDHVVSRVNLENRVPCGTYEDFCAFVPEDYPDIARVLIDEIQMAPVETLDHLLELKRHGYTIHLYGLDRTYVGELFPLIQVLASHLDVEEFIGNAVCNVCSGVATHTQRLLNGEPVSTIGPLIALDAVHGGVNEFTYEPRCYDCFVAPIKEVSL